MALFEGKTPSERNKLIAAIVCGGVALLLVARAFLGTSSTPTKTSRATRGGRATQTAPGPNVNAPAGELDESLLIPTPVVYTRWQPAVPEAGRNIFAFYVKPVAPKPSPGDVAPPTPTPTPPPPQ